jgi:hypothetical protein
MQLNWMTCASDGCEHAVTDDDFTRGHRLGEGRYRAVCGAEVTPQALIAPPGQRCGSCRATLAPRKRATQLRRFRRAS